MNPIAIIAIVLSTLFNIPPQPIHTIAGVVKVNSKQKKATYQELPCSEKNREQVIDLITTLGTNSYVSLLLNHKSRLEKIGEDIKHLHPYKFIGCIFSTDGDHRKSMQNNLREIMNSSMTRSNFFDNGIAPSLGNEAIKNNLNRYTTDFANEIHIPEDKIKPFITKKDWNGLMWFLIEYPYPN